MPSWTCLMYHDVSTAPTEATGGPERFSVPRESFARQLDWLTESGLSGSTLSQALSGSAGSVVAITFDDGNEGQFRNAVPELLERGMQATFFITTDWVGRPGYVSWDDLRTMRDAGMEIQSHTRSHPFLSELSESELRAELEQSKAALDRELDQDTDTMALPGGDFPRTKSRRLLAASGYRTVATSKWGINASADPGTDAGVRSIKRCTIQGTPSREYFLLVSRGDRWLGLRRRLRDAALQGLHRTLGRSRYHHLRRRFLDAVGR